MGKGKIGRLSDAYKGGRQENVGVEKAEGAVDGECSEREERGSEPRSIFVKKEGGEKSCRVKVNNGCTPSSYLQE